jgi:hypothetical protein
VGSPWSLVFGVFFVLWGLGLGLTRPLWLQRRPAVAWWFGVSPWEAQHDGFVRRLARAEVVLGVLTLVSWATWGRTVPGPAYEALVAPVAYAIVAALARALSYGRLLTS